MFHSFKSVMEITFVDVNHATKSASMEINSVESFLRRVASVMSRGASICEEFCDKVESGVRILEKNDYTLEEIEEIKCRLDIEYFTPLVERLVSIGYCCTQVQKDAGKDKCTAWFEPMSED